MELYNEIKNYDFNVFIENKGTLPQLTILEQQYLKTITDYSVFKAIVGEEIYNKLSSKFSKKFDFNFSYAESFTEDVLKNIEIISRAIGNKNKIKFTNNSKNNGIKKSNGVPYKLIFCDIRKLWQVLVYIKEPDTHKCRVILCNLERMENIEELENDIETDYDIISKTIRYTEQIQNAVKNKKSTKPSFEPLVLEVKNVYSNPERCFMMFRDYEHKAVYDDGKDVYKLTVYYYPFDRRTILRNILSLGGYATVISPEDIRDDIINRLKRIKENEVHL